MVFKNSLNIKFIRKQLKVLNIINLPHPEGDNVLTIIYRKNNEH